VENTVYRRSEDVEIFELYSCAIKIDAVLLDISNGSNH
jgi:hypothetical protein